jgi:hypothetical protein
VTRFCWLAAVLHARNVYYVDKVNELGVIKLVKRLSKAVSWHVDSRQVSEADSAKLVLLFGVFKVSVDILCRLVVAIFLDYIKRRLVVSIQSNRLKIIANVSYL